MVLPVWYGLTQIVLEMRPLMHIWYSEWNLIKQWSVFMLSGQKSDMALMDTAKQPTNLLVTFLEYCSVISQDIKGSLCEIWSVSLALVVILSVRLPKWFDAHFLSCWGWEPGSVEAHTMLASCLGFLQRSGWQWHLVSLPHPLDCVKM